MSNSLASFIGLYLRIGALGFGGPQAHIAMLRDEIVNNRGWVDGDRFDEGLGLCEALPGPTSSQMAIYLGWQQRGWIGGLISGLCFLLPGFLIVLSPFAHGNRMEKYAPTRLHPGSSRIL